MRGRSPPRPPRGAHRSLPTERDLRKYARLFVRLDTDEDGFVSQEDCTSTFHKAGLPEQALIDIWGLVDRFHSGSIGFEPFVGAMHLIRTVRAGEPMPSTIPTDLRHYLGDIRESPRYLARQGSSRSASVGKSADGNHAPTMRHCRKYARYFVELDTNRSGSLTTDEMYNALLPGRCGLTPTEVDQIIRLADVNQNGEFNFLQFVAAMHLVRLCRLRLPLPSLSQGLPQELTGFLSALHETPYDLALEGGSRSASRTREHTPAPAADGFGFEQPAAGPEFGREASVGDDFAAPGFGGNGGFDDAGFGDGGGFGDAGFDDGKAVKKKSSKKDHKHKHHHKDSGSDDDHHHRKHRSHKHKHSDSDDSDHGRHHRHQHKDKDSGSDDDHHHRKHRSHKHKRHDEHRHSDRDDWFKGDDPYGWDDRPGTRMGMPLTDPAALGNSRLSYLARLDYLYGSTEPEDQHRARLREAGAAESALKGMGLKSAVVERSVDRAAASAPVLSTIMPNFLPPSGQAPGGRRPGGAQPHPHALGFAAHPPALAELRQRLELLAAPPAEVLRRQLVDLPAKAFERMDAGGPVSRAAAPSRQSSGAAAPLRDAGAEPTSQQAPAQQAPAQQAPAQQAPAEQAPVVPMEPVAVKRPMGPARMACC